MRSPSGRAAQRPSGLRGAASSLSWTRIAVGAAMLAGLGFGGVKAYQYFYPSTPVAIAPQTAAAARRTIVEQVSLPGTVGAARTARLSFSAASSGVSISGTVRSISVRTGDVVTAGQEVARLDTVSLDLAVQSARSALAVQQLKMKDLLDGPLPADAIAAEQSVLSAMSSLNSAQNTLVTAQTALATLQARTDAATQARNTQSRIDAFQAQKTDAESQFAAKLDAIAAQGRSAAAVTAMREAFSTLDRAVAARCNVTANRAPCLAATSSVSNLDALVAQVDAQATSPSPDPEEGETRVTLPGALAKFEASGASADIETLMDSAFYIVQASASLPGLSAQLSARVLAVSTGSSALPPTADEMTNAARTRDAATTSLDAARNGLEAARARRDQLMGGPLPTELALQEQSLAQSEIALNRALNDQRGATLVAPFDGIIGAITMNVGEPSGSGSVILIDPLTMQLNATAQESDVAKLKVGQTVQLTFDAYAGVTLPGTVSTVAPEATVTQGVASYAVAIAVNRQAGSSAAAGSATPSARPTGAAGSATPGARPTGAAGSATPGARPTGAAGSGTPAAGAAGSATPAARATGGTQQAAQNVVLRSGMTGTGDVEIQRHTDVLTVPARAVKRQGRTSVVTVVVGDKQETRTVQTGASDATYVEITSGLNEGDLVALPGSTTGAAAGTATRASTVTTGAGAQGAGGAPPSFGPRPGG